jgi:DNA mismatch repair ATPase MutL
MTRDSWEWRKIVLQAKVHSGLLEEEEKDEEKKDKEEEEEKEEEEKKDDKEEKDKEEEKKEEETNEDEEEEKKEDEEEEKKDDKKEKDKEEEKKKEEEEKNAYDVVMMEAFCNVVIECDTHAKLIAFIKMYCYKTCSKIRIASICLDTFCGRPVPVPDVHSKILPPSFNSVGRWGQNFAKYFYLYTRRLKSSVVKTENRILSKTLVSIYQTERYPEAASETLVLQC